MDNVSGKGQWFKEDVETETVEVEAVKDYRPFNKQLFCEIVKEAKIEYSVTKSKSMGDALVHLESVNKLLQ